METTKPVLRSSMTTFTDNPSFVSILPQVKSLFGSSPTTDSRHREDAERASTWSPNGRLIEQADEETEEFQSFSCTEREDTLPKPNECGVPRSVGREQSLELLLQLI